MNNAVPLTTINGIDPELTPELFATWLLELGAAQNTVGQYVRAAGRWFGILKGSDVSPAVAWLKWKAPAAEKRLTGFAMRKYGEFLREFGCEVELGIPKRLPPCSRPNPHPIQRVELKSMRLAAKHTFPEPHDSFSVRIFLAVLDELALRRSEAFFDWEDVDFKTAVVLIHGKGGDTRRLPLSRRLVRLLNWLRRRTPLYPWTGNDGRRLKPDSMYRRFKRLARIIGSPALRPHWLRHGRLTAIAATPRGFDPVNLCGFSGHRQISSLRYYCQPQMDRLRELMESSLSR